MKTPAPPCQLAGQFRSLNPDAVDDVTDGSLD